MKKRRSFVSYCNKFVCSTDCCSNAMQYIRLLHLSRKSRQIESLQNRIKCKTFKKQIPLLLLVIISWKFLSFINLSNNLNRKSYMTVHIKCFDKRDFLKFNNLYQTKLPMNRSKVFKPMFFGQYEYHGIMSVATTRMNLEQKLRWLTYV